MYRWVDNKYNRLLSLLIILMTGRPLWRDNRFGSVIFAGLILLLLVILINSRLFNRHGRWMFLFLAGLAFLTQVSANLLPRPIYIHDYVSLLVTGLLINSIFLGMSIYLIVRELFSQKKVTNDTIKGGICAYIMIGIVWSVLYQIVFLIDPSSFQATCEGCSLDLFHFSFVTLTSLGYGDMVPVNTWSRSLANIEAIIGMMYPAVYIARLVGLYSHEK